MTNEWLDARIARTRALILAHEDAIEALASGAQSYTLDTGQNRQTVTRADLAQLNRVMSSLESRLATLWGRRYGSSSTIARPAW